MREGWSEAILVCFGDVQSWCSYPGSGVPLFGFSSGLPACYFSDLIALILPMRQFSQRDQRNCLSPLGSSHSPVACESVGAGGEVAEPRGRQLSSLWRACQEYPEVRQDGSHLKGPKQKGWKWFTRVSNPSL